MSLSTSSIIWCSLAGKVTMDLGKSDNSLQPVLWLPVDPLLIHNTVCSMHLPSALLVSVVYCGSQKSSPPTNNTMRYFYSWWTCVLKSVAQPYSNMVGHCVYQFLLIYLNICVNCVTFTSKTPEIVTIQFTIMKYTNIFL